MEFFLCSFKCKIIIKKMFVKIFQKIDLKTILEIKCNTIVFNRKSKILKYVIKLQKNDIDVYINYVY